MSEKLGHAVYVVVWRDQRIVKAGYTHRKRWREFVARGGELLSVTRFATSREAFAFEDDLLDFLGGVAIPAFNSASDAAEILGLSGQGYSECWRLDDESDVDAVLSCRPTMTPNQTLMGIPEAMLQASVAHSRGQYTTQHST